VVLEGQGRTVRAPDARAVVGDLDELGAVVLEADLFFWRRGRGERGRREGGGEGEEGREGGERRCPSE